VQFYNGELILRLLWLIPIHARKADVFVHGTASVVSCWKKSPSQFNQCVLNWLQFAQTVVLPSSSPRSLLPSTPLFATMVFTAAQLTAFFTTVDYLGLSARTAAAIAAEGITEPSDLAEFNKEGLDAIFRNLHNPPMLSKVVQGVVLVAVVDAG
jgi:hypothetical protein